MKWLSATLDGLALVARPVTSPSEKHYPEFNNDIGTAGRLQTRQSMPRHPDLSVDPLSGRDFFGSATFLLSDHVTGNCHSDSDNDNHNRRDGVDRGIQP